VTLARAAIRIYALAVRAFPPAHRAAYAAEMVDAFDREFAAQLRTHGRWRAVQFVLAAWLDGVSTGLGERRRTRDKARRLAGSPGVSGLDVKLALRMLVRFPGLSIAGGLALAIAIGVGAGWYALTGAIFRPVLPLDEGERVVAVEMHNSASSRTEFRLLHDFLGWRRDVRSIVDLGAYRPLERNLILGDGRGELVTVAETTASAFTLTRVPPLLGRPLLEADEQLSAPPVVVIGYSGWRQWFDGDPDVIGRTLQVGRVISTVVGVMPEGFAFPVNHRLWVPLRLRPGYAPLEGPAIRTFGRLAEGATLRQAQSEISALAGRTAAASPETHQHLRPHLLAYGAEYLGEGAWLQYAMLHVPVLLVLVVACVSVGTLTYARAATREAEFALRYALGASRGRIITQLFVEALVLAVLAAVGGLTAASAGLRWFFALLSQEGQGLPFWIDPRLTFTTALYAAVLAVASAALFGVLPALKATGARVQTQLKNLGAGGSTLRFGRVWTAVMIAQVALTVVCIPRAMGFVEEAMRDHVIRKRFPAGKYLAVRIEVDREPMPASESAESAFAARFEQMYLELERRVAEVSGVLAVTFGDRLPGMGAEVRGAEVEASPGAELIQVRSLWTAAVGPGYFEAFEKPILSGRGFHDGDHAAGARTALVNEAFARRYSSRTGASPVGRRLRFAASDPASPEPWLEIVGMVRDIGMTPTDFGEAPYVYRAASPATASPLMMGVRTAGDPLSLAPRVRTIAADLDAGLRVKSAQSLDELVWEEDEPHLITSGAIAVVVGLGLFLSAVGIFSLMSVSVARRTREIGLRSALGASQSRVLAGVFSHALVLVGSGVAAGNLLWLLVVTVAGDLGLGRVVRDLATTSAVMLIVGLLACVHPARRALRIQPVDALKEA